MRENIFKVNLYKNVSTKDTFVWGGFDSLEIDAVKNIHSMALGNLPKSFPENEYIIYDLSKSVKREVKQKSIFQGITLLSFDWKNLTKSSKYQNFLNLISRKIKKCEDRKVNCEIYGCLSNYDICIISYFDEIREFILFVEKIQEIKLEKGKTVFSNTFSILKPNGEKSAGNCFLNQNEEIKVQIQLTYHCQIEWDWIISLFKEKLFDGSFPSKDCVFSSLGEYDIVIEMPCNKMKSEWFVGTEAIFSPENPAFGNMIYQCSTRFMLVKDTKRTKNDLSKINNENKNNGRKSTINTSNIKELFHITGNDSIKHMVKLLYKDYMKAMQSQQESWKYDVIYQCNAVVDCMKIFTKSLKDEEKNYLLENQEKNFYKQIINDLEYSINHLGQSFGFRGLWSSNSFRNTGSYDKIFKFYYGIVKGVLATIYTAANKEQSELIPIITIDAVMLPTSTIYLDYISAGKDDKRLLSISLPMDVWYNILYYAPLLIHEIAHYLCPIDREHRNKEVLFILVTHILEVYYQDFKQVSSSIDRKDMIKWLEEHWEWVLSSFNLNYKDTWKEFFAKVCYEIEEPENGMEHNIIRSLVKDYILDKEKYEMGDNGDFRRKKEVIKIKIEGISTGIREAVADKFMIDYMEMDCETYIAYLIAARIKCEIAPDRKLQPDFSMETIVRVGITLDNYGKEIFDDSRIIRKKELLKKFLYSRIKSITESILLRTYMEEGKQSKSLENLIRTYYEHILEAYVNYQYDMAYYRQRLCGIVKRNSFDFENAVNVHSCPNFKKVKYNKIMKMLLINTGTVFKTLKEGIDTIKTESESQVKISNSKLIQVIEPFLLQPTLSELGEYKRSIEGHFRAPKLKEGIKKSISILSGEKGSYNDTIYIHSMENIAFVFNTLKGMLCDKESETLWFRGQTNEEWKLTPAVFRKGKDYKKRFTASYEKFRADAWSGVELHGGIGSEADWIAYMQHYLVPTNFLDWSEQPLTSMYFALENFFETYCRYQTEDPFLKKCRLREKEEEIGNNAILYALNPKRMNTVLHNGTMLQYDVPNLSIEKNEEKYSMYLIPRKKFLVEAEDIDRLFEPLTYLEDKEPIKFNQLPIAIQTAQLSSRLKAQRGHFVAYNANVVIDSKKIEGMLDLVEIQQAAYKRLGDAFRPFLIKVIIPDYLKEIFYKWVYNMGISLSRIYPELGNIGKDIRKNIYDN